MKLNITLESIQTCSDRLKVLSEHRTPDPSPIFLKSYPSVRVDNLDSILKVLEAVQTRLMKQADNLTNLRTEIDDMSAALSLLTERSTNASAAKRSKPIRKPRRRRSTADALMEANSNLSDGDMDVEMHLEGVNKFFIKNSSYKNLL